MLLARLAEEYAPSQVPAGEDAAVAEVMMRIESAKAFEDLAAVIDPGIGVVLNYFAFRMAALALRTENPAPISSGLVAAQLAMMVDDSRNVVPTYSILYRSAEELGVDAVKIFRLMSLMPQGPWRETPAEFAAREPAAKDISVMGIELIRSVDGPTYRPKTS
jgi:hypothetical protein